MMAGLSAGSRRQGRSVAATRLSDDAGLTRSYSGAHRWAGSWGRASLRSGRPNIKTGGLDGLTRNGRTISAGMTGRLQPERVHGLAGIRTLLLAVGQTAGHQLQRLARPSRCPC